MAYLPKETDTVEEKFLGFLYPEIKDLAKHFLTLVSAVLVFSVTFSEKIVSFASATKLQRIAIVVCWLLWICAVVSIGVAIFINFANATQVLYRRNRDIALLLRYTYKAMNVGGILFVAGLCVLAISAVLKLLS